MKREARLQLLIAHIDDYFEELIYPDALAKARLRRYRHIQELKKLATQEEATDETI